jgi:hypothetical protein
MQELMFSRQNTKLKRDKPSRPPSRPQIKLATSSARLIPESQKHLNDLASLIIPVKGVQPHLPHCGVRLRWHLGTNLPNIVNDLSSPIKQATPGALGPRSLSHLLSFRNNIRFRVMPHMVRPRVDLCSSWLMLRLMLAMGMVMGTILGLDLGR